MRLQKSRGNIKAQKKEKKHMKSIMEVRSTLLKMLLRKSRRSEQDIKMKTTTTNTTNTTKSKTSKFFRPISMSQKQNRPSSLIMTGPQIPKWKETTLERISPKKIRKKKRKKLIWRKNTSTLRANPTTIDLNIKARQINSTNDGKI